MSTSTTLERQATFGEAGTGNLVIESDNLVALELLASTHRGRFKVVYIDPPYNSGKVHYRFSDRFKGSRSVDPEDTPQVERDRHKNYERFMRPRLTRIRELIAPDGAIFVSIDDHELFRLGIVMDEIFGEDNRLAVICWEKKYGTQNDARFFSDSHEYVLCYSKDRSRAKIRLLPRSAEMDARYRNPDSDPRGPWKAGDFSVKTPSPRYLYPIETPSGRTVTPPSGRSWCTGEPRFRELEAEGRIWFGRKGDAKPQLKQFLTEVQSGRVPGSLWTYREVGHTDTAKKELKRILDLAGRDFQTPKPLGLVKRCIELFAKPGDLVLDAFAGTGTTGQAVLELNRSDGGHRRFVLIESGEGNDRFCRELTVERLRRVVDGERHAGRVEGTGGGFDYVRVKVGAPGPRFPARKPVR